MRTIACFGDQTSGTFPRCSRYGPYSAETAVPLRLRPESTRAGSEEGRLFSQAIRTDNLLNVNIFNSVTSP